MKPKVLFGMICGLFIVLHAFASYAECIVCNNKVVCIEASKAETLNKCGRPITVQKEEWELSIKETWTYITNGSYRYLYFDANKLVGIKDGTAAD